MLKFAVLSGLFFGADHAVWTLLSNEGLSNEEQQRGMREATYVLSGTREPQN